MTGKNCVTGVIENMIKTTGEQSKKGIIPFSKCTIGVEEVEAVTKVLTGQNNKDGNIWLAAGPETEAFEKEFAEYVGCKYAIFTNSGTSALKMAWKYFLDNGYYHNYKLLTPNTFCATYSSAEEMGFSTHKEMSRFITIATHYGGVRYEGYCDIEDSAHRIKPNDPLIGKIRIYSFYATKNMTTGSGGMLVTNSKEIYERCRLFWRDGLSTSTSDRLKTGGRKHDYRVLAFSGGYDGNDISASIGRVQLKKLPEFTRRRNEIVKRYNSELGQSWTGNHLWPYFVQSEQEVHDLIAFMDAKGIKCGYHYPGTGWLGVSLPIYPLLTDKEVEYIIKCVKEWK